MQIKQELREFYYQLRQDLDRKKGQKLSVKIKNNLLSLDEIQKSVNILVYISFRNEVITHSLIKELIDRGKNVFAPYCIVEKKEMKIAPIHNFEQDLTRDAYGILAPRKDIRGDYLPEQLEVVIVPGIVFSRTGDRIGYGGGYYDRFLAKLLPETVTIGLTYDLLLVDSLPSEEHDLGVDRIITEKDIITTGRVQD